MKKIKMLFMKLSFIVTLLIVFSSSTYAADYAAYPLEELYEGKLAIIYFVDDNPGVLYVGGTAAWRHNNPGNLEYHSTQIAQGNRFAIFSSYSAGYDAMEEMILRKYGNYTISDMMYEYAPPHENDTEAYIYSLTKRTGVTRDTLVSSLNSSQYSNYLAGICHFEGYKAGKVVKTTITRY